MTNVRIANIVEKSVVDGPDTRTVVYFQGCSLECKGCQNFAIWSKVGGQQMPVGDLSRHLTHLSPHHNYTIQGGEPTDQPKALNELMRLLRIADPQAHIIVYTGRTWEELTPAVRKSLEQADVVVDGRFEYDKDDPYILWRGSRNQRPIDVRATLDAGEVVTLDWSKPRLIVATDGTVSMPVGLYADFAEMGEREKSRRCGDYRS